MKPKDHPLEFFSGSVRLFIGENFSVRFYCYKTVFLKFLNLESSPFSLEGPSLELFVLVQYIMPFFLTFKVTF